MADLSVAQLMEIDVWGEHPVHTRTEWQDEVAAGDTQRGYWDWVQAMIEQYGEDED
jgi:hypothetical protein